MPEPRFRVVAPPPVLEVEACDQDGDRLRLVADATSAWAEIEADIGASVQLDAGDIRNIREWAESADPSHISTVELVAVATLAVFGAAATITADGLLALRAAVVALLLFIVVAYAARGRR